MTWKAWLVLLLFLFWAGGSWYWYTCEIKGFCPGDSGWSGIVSPDNSLSGQTDTMEVVNAESLTLTQRSSPLTFQWGEEKPDTAAGWNNEIKEVVGGSEPGKVLEITAPFTMTEGDMDFGVNRARMIKNLLAESLDTSNVLTKARLVESVTEDSIYQLADISFRWIRNNEQVRELADGALIYFPYKSDEKIDDPSINTYLEELATDLSDGSKSVEVIGHTDDKGSAAYNLKLGKERAEAIKALLIELGVPDERITATSKGESEPLAPNISEENKARNRRTEIKVK